MSWEDKSLYVEIVHCFPNAAPAPGFNNTVLKVKHFVHVCFCSYIVGIESLRFVDVALSFPLLTPFLLLSCYWKLKICYSVTFSRFACHDCHDRGTLLGVGINIINY